MNRDIYLVIIYLVIFNPISLLGTEYPKERIHPLEIDSVTLLIEHCISLEMTIVGELPSTTEIAFIKLTEKEKKKFIKQWGKVSSFSEGRALLTHHNLTYSLYAKDQPLILTEISTLTRNMTIYSNNEQVFSGKIGSAFGKYLFKFLSRLEIIDQLTRSGHLDGID
jgi:hypothetical protein